MPNKTPPIELTNGENLTNQYCATKETNEALEAGSGDQTREDIANVIKNEGENKRSEILEGYSKGYPKSFEEYSPNLRMIIEEYENNMNIINTKEQAVKTKIEKLNQEMLKLNSLSDAELIEIREFAYEIITDYVEIIDILKAIDRTIMMLFMKNVKKIISDVHPAPNQSMENFIRRRNNISRFAKDTMILCERMFEMHKKSLTYFAREKTKIVNIHNNKIMILRGNDFRKSKKIIKEQEKQ